jgi:hypothetical protein
MLRINILHKLLSKKFILMRIILIPAFFAMNSFGQDGPSSIDEEYLHQLVDAGRVDEILNRLSTN